MNCTINEWGNFQSYVTGTGEFLDTYLVPYKNDFKMEKDVNVY